MQSKKALLLGCGSKWGSSFSKTVAESDYSVDLITSNNLNYPNINSIKINWNNFDLNSLKKHIDLKEYDLIFFNQNSGGSVGEHYLKTDNTISLDHWNLSYWIDCQLPYYIIKHLSPLIKNSTKIGWMLTGLITGRDENFFQYAGYACSKSTNLHIMRGFSRFHHGVFFAINPFWFPPEDYEKDSKKILEIIENITEEDSGKTFDKNGKEWI